ncbi:MAG TPA: YhcN/YlaJ family sporulation lipoprotein [Bacillales bacterium]|nr:YhcN/YlaJ family sporulation lipoprotein [Bacillales bacterium]
MKKILLFTAAASLTLGLGACSSDHNGLNPKKVKNQSFELSNRTEPGNAKNPRRKIDIDQGRFGFVRVHEGPDGRMPGNQPNVDFENLADTVSRVAVNLPHVSDVATLVTSRAALIGYQTDSDNRHLTAEQVKSTAMSVLPRYYHVYVTDDPTLIKDIARFRNLPPTTDIQQMLDTTVKEMKKQSPQGRDMGPNENPNGEPKKGIDKDTTS